MHPAVRISVLALLPQTLKQYVSIPDFVKVTKLDYAVRIAEGLFIPPPSVAPLACPRGPQCTTPTRSHLHAAASIPATRTTIVAWEVAKRYHRNSR